MTELRIWVEGNERVVRGVTDETTCETILLAVAGATRKAGKCALVEKWRDFERVLPLYSRPLRDLKMWGSSSSNAMLEMKIQTDCTAPQSGHHSALSERSVTRLIELQNEQLDRLTRDLELLDAFISCYQHTRNVHNDEFVSRLEMVIQVQSCYLQGFSALQIELTSQKSAYSVALKKLRSLKAKIRNADLQLEDLQSVAEKLYSSITLIEFKTKSSVKEEAQLCSAEEGRLMQEVESVRVEVSKRTDISATQSSLLKDIEQSLNQIEQEINAKRKYEKECAILIEEFENSTVPRLSGDNFEGMSEELEVDLESKHFNSRDIGETVSADQHIHSETKPHILTILQRTRNNTTGAQKEAMKISHLGSTGIIV